MCTALQRFVSRQMRAVLVDWLVDVHNKFKLNSESLFLGIWILDKFLSKQEVERKDLQLVRNIVPALQLAC
jgi:Cyclin, N-terminal domain